MNKIITTGTTFALLFFLVSLTGCSDPAEPELAKEQAVPVAVDQTEVPFDISLITRTGDVAITNTSEISAEELDDGFTRRVFETAHLCAALREESAVDLVAALTNRDTS